VLTKPTPISCPMSSRFKDIFDFLPDVSSLSAPTLDSSHTKLAVETTDNSQPVDTTYESMMQKSARVKLGGGLEAIKWKLNELSCLHKHNQDVLSEVGSEL